MTPKLKAEFEAILNDRFKPTADSPLTFCIHTSCMLSDVYELMAAAYNLDLEDAGHAEASKDIVKKSDVVEAISKLQSKILHMSDDEKTNDFFIMGTFNECFDKIELLTIITKG